MRLSEIPLVSFFQSAERTKMSYEFKKEEFEILKSIFIRKYKKWIFTTLAKKLRSAGPLLRE